MIYWKNSGRKHSFEIHWILLLLSTFDSSIFFVNFHVNPLLISHANMALYKLHSMVGMTNVLYINAVHVSTWSLYIPSCGIYVLFPKLVLQSDGP